MIFENFDAEHFSSLIAVEESWWAWGILGGTHYVTNRHLALTFFPVEADDYEEGWMLLDCLEQKFKTSPTEGVTLVCQCGDIQVKDSKITEKLDATFKKKPEQSGVVTPFIYAYKNFRYRWCKMDGFNLFLQDQYLSILWDSVAKTIYAESPNSPAYLGDGSILILPVKNLENVVDSSFEEFEKLSKSLPQATGTTESA